MNLIELLAALGIEIAKYANTSKSKARSDKIANLKHKLRDERAKGQLSDDAEIERLCDEIQIEVEALYNEVLTSRG